MKLSFWEFVRERHSIFLRRQTGESPPWTQDEVLANYHFTNVYRELDPGTVFIRRILNSYTASVEEKILNVTMYRLCLHEDSFAAVGWWDLRGFSGEEWARKLHQVKDPFHGAYYIHNLGLNIQKADAMGMVADYLAANLRALQQNGLPPTRQEFVLGLSETKGIGPFIATQVLADLCYDGHVPYPEEGWVGLGPGALKGLALADPCAVDGQHALEKLWGSQPEWLRAEKGFRPLTRMNLQNCCCEYSKYHGHPRRRFRAEERTPAQRQLL